MRRTVSTFFLLLVFKLGSAQVFTIDQFIEMVRANHPIMKQAGLRIQQADADLLSAKGGFDPLVGMDAKRKTFDGTNYYYYTNPELKIPTWIGADIKAGIENNGGQYITSEASAGQSSYLGIEMPLAKGLLMDKRRATLQQAKIYREQSEQERLNMLNNLLFDAYQAYWQWTGRFQLFNIYSRFVEIAKDRYRLVKIAFREGDRSSVDTVEALTQVQQFQLMQSDALLQLTNAQLDLSNYLWSENDSLFMLPASFKPDTVQFVRYKDLPPAEDLLQRANRFNPQLRIYDFKLNALDVDRRLKRQQILPSIDLKANLLNQGHNVFKGWNAGLFENNYILGLGIKMPLFLREGRGDYKKSLLKIRETRYEQQYKRVEVENKVRSYLNETTQLQQQLGLMQSALNNYQVLLNAEYFRFQNGESSLFLINTRENKLIETAEKLISLRVKYLKSRYGIDWSAGLLQ